MELLAALDQFDGKHTDALKAAVIAAKTAPVGVLEAACHDPNRAVAATWVVKALCEADAAGGLDRAAAGGGYRSGAGGAGGSVYSGSGIGAGMAAGQR